MDDTAIVRSTVRARILTDLDNFLETTTNVKQHVSTSKKGKKFVVKQHEREVYMQGYKPGIHNADSDLFSLKVAHPEYGVFSIGSAGKSGIGADPVHHYRGRKSGWAIYLWNGGDMPSINGLPPRKIGDERTDLFPQLFKTKKEASAHLIAWAKKEGLKEQKLKEATQLVRAYARVRGGKRQFVHQYNREVNDAKIVGATPKEDKLIRELLSRHDPKVVKSVSKFYVLDKKQFDALVRKSTGKRYDTTDVIAWYDENKEFIAINRSHIELAWKSTLDHEMGHAAYYHSPKHRDWIVAYEKHDKFDEFTWYSKTKVQEAFAESYMAYIAAGGKAKSTRHKIVFDVVKSITKAVKPSMNFWKYLKEK